MFLVATGWLAAVTLLLENHAIMIMTVVGASALLAHFGAEALIKIVSQLDACVHFPVASDSNAAELVYDIATKVPGIVLEVGNLKNCEWQHLSKIKDYAVEMERVWVASMNYFCVNYNVGSFFNCITRG